MPKGSEFSRHRWGNIIKTPEPTFRFFSTNLEGIFEGDLREAKKKLARLNKNELIAAKTYLYRLIQEHQGDNNDLSHDPDTANKTDGIRFLSKGIRHLQELQLDVERRLFDFQD